MVLSVEQVPISALGLPTGLVTSFNISASAFNLENILFNLCEACRDFSMAAIPPSAFSAGRIRDTQRDMKISTLKRSADNRTKYYDAAAELSPVKYNSKLMNSIWGFYNRYSPHNVKKVAEANGFVGELPQSSGNSSIKNEILTFPSGELKKMWKNFNIQHSN